jgi:hypothetical protein
VSSSHMRRLFEMEWIVNEMKCNEICPTRYLVKWPNDAFAGVGLEILQDQLPNDQPRLGRRSCGLHPRSRLRRENLCAAPSPFPLLVFRAKFASRQNAPSRHIFCMSGMLVDTT